MPQKTSLCLKIYIATIECYFIKSFCPDIKLCLKFRFYWFICSLNEKRRHKFPCKTKHKMKHLGLHNNHTIRNLTNVNVYSKRETFKLYVVFLNNCFWNYLLILIANIVYSKEDKGTIMNCFKSKGWGGKRICKEFPSNNWTKSAVNRISKNGRTLRKPGTA